MDELLPKGPPINEPCMVYHNIGSLDTRKQIKQHNNYKYVLLVANKINHTETQNTKELKRQET